ncbi:PepSY domain-containing protein [Krasilnikovia sp. MM14-A1259]|uniref:PepSY domain-containing protein n=1 Tax=Krasilnikovia sp. MM14-A1259 TaxID=3373539 RepID=UPI00381E5C70
MISFRTAGTLAIGLAAALGVGGTALASSGADDSAAHVRADDKGGRAVPMLPNGDPIAPSRSDDSTSAPTAAPTAAGVVSIDTARAIALRATGGGRVTSIEAETEHGRAVWDVDVVAGGVRHDIDVDQATGAVTRHRVKGASGGSVADDRGRGSDDTTADDRGRGQGQGSDDTTADDRGRGQGSDDTTADDRGRGGDDRGGDDHGSGRHGSDD